MPLKAFHFHRALIQFQAGFISLHVTSQVPETQNREQEWKLFNTAYVMLF